VRDDLEVAQPRIGAGADHHLGDLASGDLPHRPDVAGARGQRDQRLERRKVDLIGDVVRRVLVGLQLDPVLFAAFGGQEAPDLAVGTGNIDVVAPRSAPMLAITCRSIALDVATPGP
jgi:hypothetical protein